ncbi:DNA polymerase delta, subunit 4-domain-containing protein [Zychaea mexicana]|uniref:DNA polymerase delta, subunit 4-domain-containing protein n=1 Tax=Zychaea mexicana TaxID=64656 RepID=UPI0022FDD06E|nr:DNA polymerase delta, subunit 4-domain-containing protein [Zychaea mexicana]KAI9496113.1 DNA polymerase delta, subunit 4-domain-containing protein [Zychaea mexicana]
MPPRRVSKRKTVSARATGKKPQQQSRITDRKPRTIKKHNDPQETKTVKPLDVSDMDNVDNGYDDRKTKKPQSAVEYIKPGIHQEHMSQTDILLRKFDLDYQYGPCAGLTRAERWYRAQKLGLNPPQNVKDALDGSNSLCVFEL